MKTVVVMGGNSGIGKATATALAQIGYRVIIHGRNSEKTAAALEEIKSVSGNLNIEAVTGALSSVAQMKKIAMDIQSRITSLDILVLSTGVILPKRQETADGLDEAFVAQYLSRFAMVQHFLPLLKKSTFARIVHVGAPTMKKARIHFEDIGLKNNYTMMTSMGQAMLANHMFVQEFARKFANENIVMNMNHVGIAKTGVAREINFFFRGLIKLFGASPQRACKNTVYLANNDEVTFSGYFLPKPGKPQVKQKINFDTAITEKLWNVSQQLIA